MYNPTQAGKSPQMIRPLCPILLDDIQRSSSIILVVLGAVTLAVYFSLSTLVRGTFISIAKKELYNLNDYRCLAQSCGFIG